MLRLLNMFDDVGLIQSNSDEAFLTWIRRIKSEKLIDSRKMKALLEKNK